MTALLDTLRSFGAPDEGTLLFNPSDYRSINYLNLLSGDPSLPLPNGVIESDGRPVLYFMDATNLADAPQARAEQIQNAATILACRGETSTLAVVTLGQITVFPVKAGYPVGDGIIAVESDESTRGIVRDIIEGTLPQEQVNYLYGASAGIGGVDDILFSVMMRVGKDLNSTPELHGCHEVILALVGRALLTRFLIDRHIITKDTFPKLFEYGPAENCFDSPISAAMTNAWLDGTFNGDLLPLPPTSKDEYEQWFGTLDADVFKKLSFIIGHTDEHGQRPLPGFINFAYVPVGLLSEVYERYAHENLEEEVRDSARRESIHYTPRHIADYMLSQAFDAVTTSDRHLAKILDPSCGAGVFVVLAFRRLIAEHWRATGQQPDTFKIRDILYQQIAGFDINNAALTLAALGLYLSALELDPEPLPTSKLKFNSNLIGSILHCVRGENEPWDSTPSVMGSLGPLVNSAHLARYDIVIGNPPWSSFPKSMSGRLTEVVRSVALRRDAHHLAEVVKTHENPDQVPDLPFVWKSMEWAKAGGTIAFALHARFLFKNSPVGIISRNHLFKALNVTGILNAAALRQSKVWPRIGAQFCLLFAKNEIPSPLNYFHFISPQYERELNERQGRLRIDYQSAEPVQSAALEAKPYLLKALYKGTALDVEVVDQIVSLVENGKAIPLKQYWLENVGPDRAGVGYQKTSTKTDASFLIEMGAVDLSKGDNAGYLIDTSQLRSFNIPRLHRPRAKTIYEPPLVLINKAIGADPDTISARISLDARPVAFNESFYGYSACGHPQASLLAKYLFAILNSELLLYYMLMISSQYGIEREVIHKADVDSFPVVPLESLSPDQLMQIDSTIEEFKLAQDTSSLNRIVCSIYGLSEYDERVISDTLSVGLPIAASKDRAQAKVSDEEANAFCEQLSSTLEPYAVRYRLDGALLQSWRFVSISLREQFDDLAYKDALVNMAQQSGTTRILIFSENCLHIGMLNQYRYWTPSRARLLALQLLRDHACFLESD